MTYPPPRNYAILSLLAVLASLPGCGRPWCLTKVADSEPTADPALIAEADREYDFGYLIATPGRKVEHRYRLTNATKQEIKILNIVNRKTCCGIVQVGKTILNPGDTTEVEVTLLVGDRFGQVTHETEVTTDLASVPSLVFRTAARAVPPIRILEDTAFDRTILIGAKEPRQAVFRAVASGTSAELPVDLDRLELRSEVKVVWAGQKEPGALDEGLRSEWRRFTATLDAAGPPGERRAEILLRRGETVLCRQPLT